MKSMIKKTTMALLILGFAASTTTTAQFGGGGDELTGEVTMFGCVPIPVGPCMPF